MTRGEEKGFRSDPALPERSPALTPGLDDRIAGGRRARIRVVAASLPVAALVLWLFAPEHGPFSIGAGFAAVIAAALLAAGVTLWTAATRLDATAKGCASADRDRIARDLTAREAAARRRAGELEHELDSFLHSVTHDLRAPLRHVDAYAGLLREALGERLDPEAAGHLRAVLEASARLSRRIDALAGLARVTRAPLEPSAVDMNRLFAEARRAVAPLAEGRDVVWDVAALAPVRGDEALLLVACTELLGNALHFTASRERAHIRVSSRHRPDGFVVTTVADDGIGFDPRGKERLFGVFERVHAEESGLGTGLATVRRVVERHGGEVSADGTEGVGASFSFALPPAATDARDAERRP